MQQNPEISVAMPSTFTLHVYRRVVDQETRTVKGYRFYLQRKDDEQAIEAYTSRPTFMAALRKKQRQQKREATGAEAPTENSTSIPVSAMEDEQGAKDSAPDAVRGGGGHTPSAFNGRSSQFIRTGPRKCPYCARVFASQHALDIHFYRNTACRARFKAEQGPRAAPKRRSQSASSSEALPRKRSDPSQSEPLETGEEGGGEHTRMDGGVNAEEDEWFREQMVELRERNRRDAERWALNKEPVEAGSAAVSQDDAHARQVAADEVELGSGKCALDRPDASERKRAGMETTGLSPYQSEDDLRVGVYCIGEGGRQEGMLRPHGKEWRVDVEGKCMTLKEFYDYSQVVLVCCVRCVSCSCAPV